MKKIGVYSIICCCFLYSCLSFDLEPAPFLQGHFLGVMSHNSYEVFRDTSPNELAETVYSTGAVSLELDIHHFNNALKVSHVGIGLSGKNSLEDYLEGTGCYRDYGLSAPWTLLIDLKTGGDTFTKAKALLEQYNIDLSRVTFVIGDFSSYSFEDLTGSFYIEGGEPDFNDPEKLDKISYFSVSWTACVSQTPAEYIAQAHAMGKPIAFWNTPDNEKTWEFLYRSGADLIKTDHPERCVAFIKTLQN
ncbi:MAG: hypothetical protein LBT11_07575 [Treponema sp.]|jgi:alkaline phosphatase|nr:hypothetical protein [Treponema sp.]